MRRTNAVDQGGSCARRDGQLGYFAGEPRLGPQVRAPLLACELQEYGLSREEFSASRSSGAEILEEGNLRRDSEWLYRTNSPGWRLGQRKQKTGPQSPKTRPRPILRRTSRWHAHRLRLRLRRSASRPPQARGRSPNGGTTWRKDGTRPSPTSGRRSIAGKRRSISTRPRRMSRPPKATRRSRSTTRMRRLRKPSTRCSTRPLQGKRLTS